MNMNLGSEESTLSKLTRGLSKAHVALFRNAETRLYAGAIKLGKSEIVTDFPTACTDGVNKFYGLDFMSTLSEPEVTGVVLHETLHVALKHMFRYPDMINKNPQLANAAMDYVVNNVIHKVTGYGTWIKLPDSALYDKKFDGWSVGEVFNFLNEGKDKDGEQKERQERYEDNASSGGGKQEGEQGKQEKQESKPGDEGEKQDGEGEGKQEQPKLKEVVVDGKSYRVDTHDEHKTDGAEMTEEQAKEVCEKIDSALQEGAIMAGAMGMDVPQVIREALAPEVDWQEVMAQFMTATAKGRDEYTWRRIDMRRAHEDLFTPAIESERAGEIAVFIDASGSTLGPVMDTFCEALSTMASACNPERVRVMFWDTQVRSEQVFEDNYEDIRSRLLPAGGGGTRVGCIPTYLTRNGIRPDCVLVLTDGYVESDYEWDVEAPTLWLVTERKSFVPKKGQMVMIKE